MAAPLAALGMCFSAVESPPKGGGYGAKKRTPGDPGRMRDFGGMVGLELLAGNVAGRDLLRPAPKGRVVCTPTPQCGRILRVDSVKAAGMASAGPWFFYLSLDWLGVSGEFAPSQRGRENNLPVAEGDSPKLSLRKGTVPFSLRENRDSPRENRDSPQVVSQPVLNGTPPAWDRSGSAGR